MASWTANQRQSVSVLPGNFHTTTGNCSEMAAAWEQQLNAQLDTGRTVDKAVTPVWYAVGIVGNVLSAIIWLQRRMRRNNSSAVYLAALSINDTIFLLLHIVLDLREAWEIPTLDHPVVCETFSVVYMVTQYMAPTLVLGFTVERYIAVCYPYQKVRFCTTSRAVKVVVGMLVGCFLLSSIQPYLWSYNPSNDKCDLRPGAERLWEVWSWTTEMLVFLLVPVLILIVNVLVMREVCRMSNAGPAGGPAPQPAGGSKTPRHDTVQGATPTVAPTGKSAATNAMLLSVSFYVICTTLPATIVYVLGNAIPEVRPAFHGACADGFPTTDVPDVESEMAAWSRFVVYATVRTVINEICVSHYACNFFLYVVTGRQFRSALRRLCCRSVPDISRDAENGTVHRGRPGSGRIAADAKQQRVLLARV